MEKKERERLRAELSKRISELDKNARELEEYIKQRRKPATEEEPSIDRDIGRLLQSSLHHSLALRDIVSGIRNMEKDISSIKNLLTVMLPVIVALILFFGSIVIFKI